MKTWLVAHRGASSEARENTLDAFNEARKYPIGYIEFDVHITNDDAAIIHHDPEINGLAIATSSYDQLLEIDPELAHFEDVVTTNNGQPLIVELKASGTSPHIAPYLATHPASYATSFLPAELLDLEKSGITTNRMFVAQHKHPFGLIKMASIHGFGGVTVNKWFLTPSFYIRANRKGLMIFAYTINNTFWARCVRLLFPKVLICTDNPGKLSKLS